MYVLTFLTESSANVCANIDVNVLLPTPPLPESTKIMCFTEAIFSLINSTSVKEKEFE